MKKYDTYKDSGIEWLGEIPEHWNQIKLKHVTSCNVETLTDNSAKDLAINYVEIGDVSLEKGIENYENILFSNAPSRAKRIVRKNDVIISTVRTYLKAITQIDQKYDGFIVSTGFAVLKPKQINSKYLGYVVSSENFIDEVISQSVGVSYPAINSSVLINIAIPIPLDLEQNIIASFLDHKTTQIDTLIEKKEQLVEKLTLKRQAIINEAVTKGLNPDVPMKDSGIEWLGEVPEHWDTFKLKHLANLKSGDFISALEISQTGEYPVLGGNGLRGYTNKFNLEGTYVLIGRQGALCGNINYSDSRFWATEHAIVCHPLTEIDTYYLGELLRSMDLNQYSESAAQPGLSVGKISNLVIPKIPLQEQIEIADFLKNKSSVINKSIIMIIESIEKLKLYRQSLISEAVTGKIDLRDWKQPSD